MTGAQRRGGLGRGLGALLPAGPGVGVLPPPEPGTGTGTGTGEAVAPGAEPTPVQGAELREVTLDSVTPNPRQPRTDFDEDALAELVHSIREIGVLQPIVVRESAPGRYELVMGERRWRAAREAGLTSMPAIVRATADDAMLRDALLENLHRQQLNPLEEAAAYQQLLAEFGVTHEELAGRLGRSRPQVSNTLRLLNLPTAVQRRVAAGVLSAGHARALLGLPDQAAQEELAGRIVAEGLSVRAVEEAVTTSVHGPRRPRRVSRVGGDRPDAMTSQAAEQLSEVLDTRVRVERGRGKGRIVVEFADDADLGRLVAAIGGTQRPPAG
jgi:ParB family chromosome partitioning protein